MANFLYNGVELPDINTAWTDKAKYPFAYIESVEGTYCLLLTDTPVEYHGGSYFQDGTSFSVWTTDTSSWQFFYDLDNSEVGVFSSDSTPIWANHNVLNADGSIYLSTSTPIKADSKLKISVGSDGVVLFDGTVTTVYDEKAKMAGGEVGDGLALAVGDYLEVVFNGTTYKGNVFAGSEEFPMPLWGEFSLEDGSMFNSIPCALGSLGELGSVLYTETEGTYNLKLIRKHTNVYYEGTEPCSYSSAFGACVSGKLLNEIGPSVGDTVYVVWDGVLYEDVVTTAASFGNAPMFGDLTLATRPYVIGYMDADGNGAGWVYATDTIGDHTLKVYSIIGGEVTSTTVTAEFTCTDLVNAGAIDSIQAWAYKKSDGLNTTIPATWTSEVFSAPRYSTTHTFTGLEPNTEYEVYGCIFVSGEATDHNAVATFTTSKGAVTETSGDGYALYNGIKLPNIDSVWTDKATLPYGQIFTFAPSAYPDTYALILSEFGLSVVDGTYKYINGPRKAVYVLTLSESVSSSQSFPLGEWFFMYEETDASLVPNDMGLSLIWSNHNITEDVNDTPLNPDDDTVVFSASDPIPLDGMTVIEWDGDTKDVKSLEDVLTPYHFVVSDKYIDFKDGDDYVCVFWNGEEYVTYPQYTALQYIKEEDGGESFWGLSAGANILLVVGANAPSMSTVCTAFMNTEGAMYTTLFAYKTPTSPDSGGSGGGSTPNPDIPDPDIPDPDNPSGGGDSGGSDTGDTEISTWDANSWLQGYLVGCALRKLL